MERIFPRGIFLVKKIIRSAHIVKNSATKSPAVAGLQLTRRARLARASSHILRRLDEQSSLQLHHHQPSST
jgi:hypothetical protein